MLVKPISGGVIPFGTSSVNREPSSEDKSVQRAGFWPIAGLLGQA